MPEKHQHLFSSDYLHSAWSMEHEDRGLYVRMSEKNYLSPCYCYLIRYYLLRQY